MLVQSDISQDFCCRKTTALKGFWFNQGRQKPPILIFLPSAGRSLKYINKSTWLNSVTTILGTLALILRNWALMPQFSSYWAWLGKKEHANSIEIKVGPWWNDARPLFATTTLLNNADDEKKRPNWRPDLYWKVLKWQIYYIYRA